MKKIAILLHTTVVVYAVSIRQIFGILLPRQAVYSIPGKDGMTKVYFQSPCQHFDIVLHVPQRVDNW